MREFKMDELSTFRCRICGCKNKLYTDILLKETCYEGSWYPCEPKKIGYTTRCCNCGHVLEWIDNNEHQIAHVNGHTKAGKTFCIHHSPCKNKKCKFWGWWAKDPKKPPKHETPKNLHFNELDVNPSITPKFL